MPSLAHTKAEFYLARGKKYPENYHLYVVNLPNDKNYRWGFGLTFAPSLMDPIARETGAPVQIRDQQILLGKLPL